MVKVVRPTPLLLEAAEVLADVRDDVVVIGAVAVQAHLADCEVALTPTRDVDAGIATDAVEHVVAHLEDRGLRRSDLPHERPFTWSRTSSRFSSCARSTRSQRARQLAFPPTTSWVSSLSTGS